MFCQAAIAVTITIAWRTQHRTESNQYRSIIITKSWNRTKEQMNVSRMFAVRPFPWIHVSIPTYECSWCVCVFVCRKVVGHRLIVCAALLLWKLLSSSSLSLSLSSRHHHKTWPHRIHRVQTANTKRKMHRSTGARLHLRAHSVSVYRVPYKVRKKVQNNTLTLNRPDTSYLSQLNVVTCWAQCFCSIRFGRTKSMHSNECTLCTAWSPFSSVTRAIYHLLMTLQHFLSCRANRRHTDSLPILSRACVCVCVVECAHTSTNNNK